VVLIPCLIEKKKIKIAEKKKRSASTVNKTRRNKRGKESHRDLVERKTLAGPGMNPLEPVIFEQQMRLKKVAGEAMRSEKSPDVPGHQQTERDSEKDDRGDVYGRESAAPRSRDKSFNSLKH
jgi:hypothetical protein